MIVVVVVTVVVVALVAHFACPPGTSVAVAYFKTG